MDRNFIRKIKYFENETLAKHFNNSKRRLEAQGIMCKERLVFHRTPHHKNVEPIFQNGLLLSKCTRFAHGYGIYFSEFPDVSQLYGQHLLLCRVLVGRHYNEGRDIGGNIPPGYNSKFMAPDKDMNICQEMRNLVRMSRGGIRVPEVVFLRNQVHYHYRYHCHYF